MSSLFVALSTWLQTLATIIMVGYFIFTGLIYLPAFELQMKANDLRGGALVSLRIRGREFQGLAEPVTEDKQAIAAGLMAHLRKVPSDARYYGVTFDDHKDPRAEEVEKAVQTVVMIRVRIC